MGRLIRVDPRKPSVGDLREAVRLIREGGVIVYPTDTVYGLGANALNSEAVLRIFKIKGRAPDQALPVIVSGPEMADRLAYLNDDAEKLMKAFWPGALTLALPKKPIVPSAVTGGGATVALRAPNHAVPLLIVRESGLPLVATSANKHGAPNPVNAGEAYRQIGGEVDLVIDCGRVGGQPSTILDLARTPPLVVRSGPVTREMVEKVVGRVDLALP